MSGMLGDFVTTEVERIVKEKYPHIQYPAAVYAKVTSAEAKGGGQYVYSLKILDKNKGDDNEFPGVPGVSSTVELQKGDIAAVVLLYGGSDVWILGRCER